MNARQRPGNYLAAFLSSPNSRPVLPREWRRRMLALGSGDPAPTLGHLFHTEFDPYALVWAEQEKSV